MRKMLATGLAALLGVAVWTTAAGEGFLSTTGPVIAILAGDLFLGEAEGRLGGSGTLRIRSRADPGVTCIGQFTYSAERGDAGTMRCSDGTTGAFQFHRLSLLRGYGTGSSSRGSISFTYGLSANESGPYLKLPAGKALRLGGDLMLVDVAQPVP